MVSWLLVFKVGLQIRLLENLQRTIRRLDNFLWSYKKWINIYKITIVYICVRNWDISHKKELLSWHCWLYLNLDIYGHFRFVQWPCLLHSVRFRSNLTRDSPKSKYLNLFALPAIGKLMIYKDFYCITTSEYLSMQNSAQFKINGLDFSKFL